ncbi:PAS domain S-box protein [Arcobacter arenosus]|uniref:histidine kinase n=1 Tax=Arcobacter arenosus TaxID=2576037 RepID=A0A5R8Y3U1_9BACT|nr:PAS domain S-box protein [Arcobacter arenosus]TLP40765.1 PAS domain S-box protein [Arcobacter arenosus]
MKKAIELFLIFIFFSILLVVTNFYVKDIYFKDSFTKIALDDAFKKMRGKELEFKKNVQQETENILFSIRKFKYLDEYIKGKVENKEIIEQLFISYLNSKKAIAQIRYINKNGFEKIKVSKTEFNSKAFADSKLERKSSRYYFKESKNKPYEVVWFSELDLKMKNCKPILPYKPIIRIILPVKNDASFAGILVIDYSMSEFLTKFTNTPFYDVILVNKKGETLYHYDKTKAWSKYNSSNFNIKEEFPLYYEEIFREDTFRSNYFVSKKLDVDIKSGLYLILQLKKSHLDAISAVEFKKEITVALITLLFSLILSFIIIKIFYKYVITIDDLKMLNFNLKNKEKTISDHVIYSRTDLHGIITDVSDAFCKLSGYTRDELIGSSHNIVRHPEMPKSVFQDMWDKLKNEENWQGEMKNLAKDGSYYWVNAIITPEYNINKKLIGFISIREDISSKKDFESQQKLMLEQSKLAAMGEMIGNIAHQWRQPLSVISSASTSVILKKEMNIDVSDKDLIKDLLMINDQTQYLSETINTFRDFLKNDKGIENIVLQDKIKEVSKIVSGTLHSKGIDLILNIDEIKPISMSLIIGELPQVIINILNNAKDALLENSVKNPWIKVDLLEKEKDVIISIEDNAGGIPEDIICKIFEPYFTTKNQSLGTGLGLYMSYKIINESLGGSLYVENTENGAKFFIKLNKNM